MTENRLMTLYIKGADKREIRELRARLNALAQSLGYDVLSDLLLAIDRGEVVLKKRGSASWQPHTRWIGKPFVEKE